MNLLREGHIEHLKIGISNHRPVNSTGLSPSAKKCTNKPLETARTGFFQDIRESSVLRKRECAKNILVPNVGRHFGVKK